ncbi:MAG: hypothetical protein JST42_09150 [Bacteroidetes bacterium]|nr:hypothetical protein [Bacteroidota bacterium]
MRSELNETYQIDCYLLRQLSEEDAAAFEARLLLDEVLAEKVEAQRTAHRLIRRYAWREERGRLAAIYHLLLEEAPFAHQIKEIFT